MTWYCIYNAIGQKRSSIAQVGKDSGRLRRQLEYTIVVAAIGVGTRAHGIHLPYAATAIANTSADSQAPCAGHLRRSFRKHAAFITSEFPYGCAARPGREAYPETYSIFTRGCWKRSPSWSDKNGGGLLTACRLLKRKPAMFPPTFQLT